MPSGVTRVDDVRRLIREEGRGSMWRVIRSTVDSGKSDRKLPDVTQDQLNEYFVGVGPRVADEVRAAGGDVTCPADCRASAPVHFSWHP